MVSKHNFMAPFSGKFIYPLFIFCFLFWLLLLLGSVVYLVLLIPAAFHRYEPVQAILLLLGGVAYMGIILLAAGIPVCMHRYTIRISNNKLYLRDVLFNKTITSDENFKGFSLTSYPRSLFPATLLTFYFHDGKVVELSQTLFTNFKKIQPALEDAGLPYLGWEPFKWKNLVFRKYHFK